MRKKGDVEKCKPLIVFGAKQGSNFGPREGSGREMGKEKEPLWPPHPFSHFPLLSKRQELCRA